MLDPNSEQKGPLTATDYETGSQGSLHFYLGETDKRYCRKRHLSSGEKCREKCHFPGTYPRKRQVLILFHHLRMMKLLAGGLF